MDFSKLSYQQILNCASILNTCAINMDMILNVELEELFAKIGNKEIWAGASASQVMDTYNNLRNNFPNFSEDLKNCANKLEAMVGEYQNVDKKVLDMK